MPRRCANCGKFVHRSERPDEGKLLVGCDECDERLTDEERSERRVQRMRDYPQYFTLEELTEQGLEHLHTD